MVIPPYAAEVSWADVVGDEIAVVGELLLADTANAVLGNDLSVEEFAHLSVGAQFTVSAGVLGIVDAAHAHLALTACLWDCFPAAAG